MQESIDVTYNFDKVISFHKERNVLTWKMCTMPTKGTNPITSPN